MTEKLVLNNIAIYPGENKTIQLSMPALYDSTPINMPVHVIRGNKPGPNLLITSAIHGDEVNGVEIVRRLLKKSQLKKMSGSLIAVPIVNVYGFLYQDRYLMDRRDLNRSFPGSSSGTLGGRLAHLIISELLSVATHCIDLHAGSLQRTNLPQIRANLVMPGVIEMAKSFNAPVVLNSKLREGSLRQVANDMSIPFLLYEAGECLRFDELSIKTGVHGILNVMHYLEMISLKKPFHSRVEPTIAKQTHWLRASHGGLFMPKKQLGNLVKKGEKIAVIANPMSRNEYIIRSPIDGIIIGMSKMPMVHEGAAIFNMASFHEIDLVEEHIDNLYDIYV